MNVMSDKASQHGKSESKLGFYLHNCALRTLYMELKWFKNNHNIK